ncbi:hypothetical protein CMQ_7231 [Grosmannia clavigera kw1407]|uniref:Uncharacterized protein n=1 Tax=Grosmannia clavigera (strain kw1407 / UAMH 11150) TaxID=655863 RepID=F0XNS3_GROCL|nr:uncharacterized protein CMQ_7231 [Grosmannia clavigera kw1407]EFX00229.1 hypothetical protein CMQ_7231 [Grosmannia clavigera kw1407]
MTGFHNVRAKKPRVSKVEQAEDDHDDIDKKPFKPMEIDIATGLKKLRDHKSFWTEDGIELKDLAKFDDLGPYEIDEDTEMVMWQIELKRLAQAAEQANAPTLEGDPKLFGHADQGGYNRLHTLVWALDLANILKTKRRQNYDDTNQKYEQALEQVGEWTIDRNCNTITSVWYSYAVLGLVGLLIMGGLGLMALGQRITGVDPSNLTVLLWTAAGFIMVYLKSRHVENWPWRDFMQGQVVCHSISEVVSVTKIDPQILIAVLMRNETRMHLEKSGPFEMLFECRDTKGFSIDVPPLVTTAMAGGRIFVRVDSDKGPALVSIAVTTQDNYMSVPVHGSTETALICRAILPSLPVAACD